ncbi:helix-turn-helix domain-containing protein [Bacillaceae bacterium]
MENTTLRLTSVLADSTRFAIYEYILAKHEAVTVQEIANHFNIHPNVARLHLGKLEDVNLLRSTTEKTGKGGRPGRLYMLSEEVVSLQFPPRDYKLLAEIAIESLISLGEQGETALVRMGKRFGHEAAKQAMHQEGIRPETSTLEEKIASIERLVVAQGLNPEIDVLDGQTIRFRVFNCTFKESAVKHRHQICKMHNALIMGIFEAYFGQIKFTHETSILDGCPSCDYTIGKIA